MARKKKIENRVLVVGHGRSGKDILSKVLNDLYGYRFRGSSEVMCQQEEIFSLFKDLYETSDELFENRHKHRVELYEAIREYNKEDKTRLAKLVMQNGQFGYTGMRDFDEVMAGINEGLFSHIIWVDRKFNAPDPSQMFSFEDLYEEFLRDDTSFSLARVMNYPVSGADNIDRKEVETRAMKKLASLFELRGMDRFLKSSGKFVMFA